LSEIYVEFRRMPLRLFGRACEVMAPNGLALSIQPEEEIRMRLTVKYPGMGNEPSTANMEFNYQKSFQVKQHPAYERVLIDCVRSDLTLFPREDEVEATWTLLDPLIEFWETHPPADFPNYPAGTWGPEEAVRFMKKEGRRWRFSDEPDTGEKSPGLSR
jgi:glucose-6-phosphate 1-dehydrogenase